MLQKLLLKQCFFKVYPNESVTLSSHPYLSLAKAACAALDIPSIKFRRPTCGATHQNVATLAPNPRAVFAFFSCKTRENLKKFPGLAPAMAATPSFSAAASQNTGSAYLKSPKTKTKPYPKLPPRGTLKKSSTKKPNTIHSSNRTESGQCRQNPPDPSPSSPGHEIPGFSTPPRQNFLFWEWEDESQGI